MDDPAGPSDPHEKLSRRPARWQLVLGLVGLAIVVGLALLLFGPGGGGHGPGRHGPDATQQAPQSDPEAVVTHDPSRWGR